MNLKKILKGTRIVYDAIQSIQGLTIIPLTCDKELSFDSKYASPFAHNVSTNNGYGHVTAVKNPNETKDVLIPPNASYIVPYMAQDHLISKAAIIKKNAVQLNDSRCIQSNQGGFLGTNKENKLYIAPLALREVAYNHVGIDEYSKLWPDIARFNREHGSGANQTLADYFKKWDKDLDKFIAHFERIDNCIGFITLFNDEVVAIDKFPSFTYTREIWDKLVRDSYASLVIQNKLLVAKKAGKLKKVNDIKNFSTPAELYDKLTQSRHVHYKSLLEEIMDVEFTTTKDKDTDGSLILKSDGYIGQIIDENEVNVLVSIIKKDKFDPENMRKASAMKKAAKSQKDFEL